MYSNYEDNSSEKRTTSVLERNRETIGFNSQSATTVKPPVGFTAVKKNPNRLTVTNAAEQQVTQPTDIATPKTKAKSVSVAITCVFMMAVIALSSLIAINASALSTLSAENAVYTSEYTVLESSYTALATELSAISSAERITELASTQLDLSATGAASTASFTVPGYVAVEAQTFDNNWFDNILDLLAK